MFQGEREMAASNKLLGQFNLEGIPPSPRGVPQIEVTFDIDVNGIVHVSAKDKASGKEQKVTIQASGGLSDAEIEQMVKDAEQNADEDKKRKELIEAKNAADSLVYSTEKSLTEYGDKLSSEDKGAAEEALSALKAVLESEDAALIKEKTESLTAASMKIGEAMDKAQSESQPAEENTANDEKVVDADFQDVEKK